MNKKFIWLSTLVIALIIGQPTFACSDTKDQSKQCHCKTNGKKISENLNLSDEQKKKIIALKKQSHHELKLNYKKIIALRTQINAMSKAEKIDEAKLDALIKQKNLVLGEMLKKHIILQHQIYTVLTAAQKTQYLALEKSRKLKLG
jgi:protein CpxP